MIVAGAKRRAKEILELFTKKNEHHRLVIFDDISTDVNDLLL